MILVGLKKKNEKKEDNIRIRWHLLPAKNTHVLTSRLNSSSCVLILQYMVVRSDGGNSSSQNRTGWDLGGRLLQKECVLVSSIGSECACLAGGVDWSLSDHRLEWPPRGIGSG